MGSRVMGSRVTGSQVTGSRVMGSRVLVCLSPLKNTEIKQYLRLRRIKLDCFKNVAKVF